MTLSEHESLHVLYLIDSIAVAGGAEESLAMLAPVYRDLGITLDVAFLHDREGLQKELRSAGAELFPLAGPGGRAGWLKRTRSLIRHRRPDLVHTTLFEADLVGRVAARLAGTPVVSSLVNLSYGSEHHASPQVASWKLRGVQFLDAATAHLTTRLHAVSTAVADTMARHLRFPRERIDVVPRGRSPGRLGSRSTARRAMARSALGVSHDDVLLLAVARQEHEKGLDLLLRAMPLVREGLGEARLVVAGREGGQTEALRGLVHRHDLGKVVTFLGTRRDIPELLCAADVFVLASRREGFPGAVLEAMALEAPIVASDLPQVREAVGSDCALLTELGSVDGLARAILETLMEPSTARSRASRARERFLDHFTPAAVGTGMHAFYLRALGRDS
jgi:glycosyltransferase involved in cell wall biosynthesis